MKTSLIHAVVVEVIRDGKHGPYAVARNDKIDGSITFSLNDQVWQETDIPEPGMFVVLARLRKKPKGWRALSARYLSPEDTRP